MTDTVLAPGLAHSETITIDKSLTVPALAANFPSLSDMPEVFATPFMVALVEWTCIEAIRPYLSTGQSSVGAKVTMDHVAATPIGMKVTAEVELVAVEGRKLSFQVKCSDERDLIGSGTHDRFIIDVEKFLGRLQSKAGAA